MLEQTLPAAEYPRCFSALRFYRNWADVNARCGDPVSSVCTDCLPSYQMRMKRVGRCSRPETVFRFDDGSIVGVAA